MRLLALCIVTVALIGGCKKKCDLGDHEDRWSDLAADLMDEDLMGGEPMGCNAKLENGSHKLWVLYSEATEKQVTDAVHKVLKSKDFTALESVDKNVYRFERKDEKIMAVVGHTGTAAELIVLRK